MLISQTPLFPPKVYDLYTRDNIDIYAQPLRFIETNQHFVNTRG